MSRFRHEYKYYINRSQEALLHIKAAGLLEPDIHAGAEGGYLIRSLYFDDLDDTCLRENIDGTDPHSKFRIRYYNDDSCRLRLEKKTKYRGMTLKETCPLTLEEYDMLVSQDFPDIAGMPRSKQKLLMDFRLRALIPKVIVSYRRVPFVYSCGNVRVTFDQNVTSSGQTDRFLAGDYGERPVFSQGGCILEVKWDEILPLHIKETLKLDSLQWTSFSKYYMSRIYHL